MDNQNTKVSAYLLPTLSVKLTMLLIPAAYMMCLHSQHVRMSLPNSVATEEGNWVPGGGSGGGTKLFLSNKTWSISLLFYYDILACNIFISRICLWLTMNCLFVCFQIWALLVSEAGLCAWSILVIFLQFDCADYFCDFLDLCFDRPHFNSPEGLHLFVTF